MWMLTVGARMLIGIRKINKELGGKYEKTVRDIFIESFGLVGCL